VSAEDNLMGNYRNLWCRLSRFNVQILETLERHYSFQHR